MTTIDHDTGLVINDDHALVPLSEVETFLATRPPVETAKELRDRLAALCVYYKGKVDVYNELYEGQLRTERYIGKTLAEVPRASRGRQDKYDTVSHLPTLDDLGFTQKQSSRLQQLASVPEDQFNNYIAARKEASERIVKSELLATTSEPLPFDAEAEYRLQTISALEPRKESHQLINQSANNEWYTPRPFLDAAHEVMGGIDLDPASNALANQAVRAEAYYTIDEDGYGQPWHGRVWLNPPFSDTPAWVARLEREYLQGEVTAALLLVNSAPGYVWWEDLWRRWPVCMLRERLRFVKADGIPGGQAKKGQTVAYFGQDIRAFIDVFAPVGRILLP